MFVKDVQQVRAFTQDGECGYIVLAAGARVKIQCLSADILRVRVHFDPRGTDYSAMSLEQLWREGMVEHSYALVRTAWADDLDELFADERQRVSGVMAEISADTEKEVVFATEHVELIMRKHPLSFKLRDKLSGAVVYSDLTERAFDKDHLGRLTHYNLIDQQHDHFFGFGEKTGYLDKRGRHMRLCPKDAIGHDPECGEPLYKHIPFYVRVNDQQNHYVGLFYNNSYDAVFDMGNERSGYWEPYSYYQVDGGDIDFFLINGPHLKDVVRRYTDLTGKSAMPTLQEMGFTASTMYYAELDKDCDQEIYKVLNKMRDSGILVDNFWLASGYSAGEKDKLRYTFNWNLRRFPKPEEFFAKLNGMGINVIPNLKPGVLMGHPYKEYYLERDALVKKPQAELESQQKQVAGDPYYVGRWWGGPGYFVDFTGPQGREAWSHLLQERILKMGTKTVWNDNNEFDGVEDREAVVAAEGKGGTMAEYKSIQSNMMAYTAKKAIAAVYPNERPYIINRAGFAGVQRYAQVWGGDNLTSWRTLKFNVATILGMGVSGVANMGCDIGGFAGPAPEAELMLRWVQNGVFQPRFTMNSANNDNTVTQPFMYPEYMEEIKAAYALRYRHLIYLYSLMRVAATEGLPVWRPLFMEFEQDARCLTDQSLSFMFGPSLLVATVLEKGQTQRPLYLPAGVTWYDLNDNFKAYEGGQVVNYPVTSTTIPMFLRDNSIVITSDDIKRIVFDQVKTLQVLVAASSATEPFSFDYYEDDGHSKDFEQGVYAQTRITVTPGEHLELKFDKTGSYEHSYEQLYVQVVSKLKGALFVSCEGEELTRYLVPDDFAAADSGWYYNMSSRVIEIKCRKPQQDKFTLVVSTKHFDLIGMENNG